MHKQASTALITLVSAIALTGCSIHIGDFNASTYKTGPTQTEKVSVPLPEDSKTVYNVELSPGVANVTVNPNAENLVQGTVDYNVPELKPIVNKSASGLTVRVPEIKGSLPRNVQNDWKFSLGRGVPMNLTVNTGASQGEYDFGGLSLRSFTWRQGAAKANIKFSAPNPEPAGAFHFEVGAAQATFSGLGNANFSDGFGSVGAGQLILYMDGQLSRNVNLVLEGGATQITIYSGGNPVRVRMESVLNTLQSNGWAKDGKEYTSPEWNSDAAAKINVTVRIGAGSVKLVAGK